MFSSVLNTPDALASFSGMYSVTIVPPFEFTTSLAASNALNTLIPPSLFKCPSAKPLSIVPASISTNAFISPLDTSSILLYISA